MNRRFLFIGGVHRSGTSLLHQCIGDHSATSIFRDTDSPEDEGQHLQSIYPAGSEFGGPGLFGLARGSRLTAESELVSEENAKRLFSDWSVHWNLDSPILVEKSPPNLIRMRFLQALFPNASFIVLIRHPLAVSLATRKWRDLRLGQLLRHWVSCQRQFELDRPFIERLKVIRYEDFVERPEEILEDVYRFIGIEPEPLRREVRPNVNDKYYERFEIMRDHDVVRRAYVSYLGLRYESEIRRYGYSLSPGEYVNSCRA